MIIAIIAIVIFYGVNLMGLKMSSRTQNVLMMLIKISMVLLLIASPLLSRSLRGIRAGSGSCGRTFLGVIASGHSGLCLVAISFTYGRLPAEHQLRA